METRRDLLGNVHPDSGFAVNHIYLNGVRIAEALPDCTAQYFLTDQVDSVKVVVNDSGKVVTRHEYRPFGEDWITEGDTKNAPKYNSQEFDKESGYYFYNARHYDPEIGRFVTADTVIPYENETQSWNRFSYTRNNPLIYKDPTGHQDYHGVTRCINPFSELKNDIDREIDKIDKKCADLYNKNKDLLEVGTQVMGLIDGWTGFPIFKGALKDKNNKSPYITKATQKAAVKNYEEGEKAGDALAWLNLGAGTMKMAATKPSFGKISEMPSSLKKGILPDFEVPKKITSYLDAAVQGAVNLFKGNVGKLFDDSKKKDQ